MSKIWVHSGDSHFLERGNLYEEIMPSELAERMPHAVKDEDGEWVASGALDRHGELRVLVSEGGASWVPFLGDRMNESYRQHSMMVEPKLSRSPKEILYSQVYASFQHDERGERADGERLPERDMGERLPAP